MTVARHFRSQNDFEKDFVGVIDKLSYNRQKWEVWQDLISVMACSISIAVDRVPGRFQKRAKEFQDALERLGGPELPGKAYDAVIDALEQNPDQDFLGSMYMRLELGNHWTGQFFTPYCVSKMMAQITLQGMKSYVEANGWASIHDPCIDGGAMMIAAANIAHEKKIDYQGHLLFVGQDIDPIVGKMAYIQLSLLGCPGYIVVADSISNPLTGDPLMPTEKPNQDFWYTPLYFTDIWMGRRQVRMMDRFLESISAEKPKKQQEKGGYTFFMDFRR